MQHQPLRPSDRKRRDQHRAAAGKCALQDRGQLGLGVGFGMVAIAVGGFADQHIGPAERFRWPHERVGIMAQITAEMDDTVADLETDLGGGQKVPGRDETGGAPVSEVDPLIEAMRLKAFQRRLCILERIERFGILVFGKPPVGGKAPLLPECVRCRAG